MYSGAGTLAGGFPHSDMSGSKLHCQLPEPFRRLARPSSPVIAKASTICTYSLDPITLKPERLLMKHISRLTPGFSFHSSPRQGVNLPVIGFLKHYIKSHQADVIQLELTVSLPIQLEN
jgi:hypothetical protein